MADITKAIVTADGTVTNLIDPTTRQSVNYKPVTVWYDNTPMTNEKCDGRLYRRKGSTYYKQVIDKDGELFLEKDTMAQFRSLSTWEILLVKSGVVKGIRLNGYYTKGDTPAPIEYFISNTTDLDNGGAVIQVGEIKFEHTFVNDINVKYFGVKGDISQNAYATCLNAFKHALNYKLNIYHPTGIYNFYTAWSPYRTLDESGDYLYDCKGITIFGDGDTSILMTETATGADVLNLYKVQRLTIKDLAVTGVLTGSNNFGTNGISIVGGYDEIQISNVYIYNLTGIQKQSYPTINNKGNWNATTNTPSLLNTDTGVNGDYYTVTVAGSQNFGGSTTFNFEIGDIVLKVNGVYVKQTYYIDGGKGLTIQSGNTTLKVGSLKADVRVKNCGYGYGMDFSNNNLLTKDSSVNVKIMAERCHRGVSLDGWFDVANPPQSNKQTSLKIDCSSLNCQEDLFVRNLVGGEISLNINTTLSAEDRRKVPDGSRYWNTQNKKVSSIRCYNAISSNISIFGFKGECDTKYEVGGELIIQTGNYTGATQNSNLTFNVSGITSTPFTLVNAGGLYIQNSNLNILSENISTIPPLVLWNSRNNTVVCRDTTYVPTLRNQVLQLTNADSASNLAEVKYEGGLGITSRQLGSAASDYPIWSFKNTAGAMRIQVLNEGSIRFVNSQGGDFKLMTGAVLPEGNIDANPSTLYFRASFSGGSFASGSVWMKQFGTGNTGWVRLDVQIATTASYGTVKQSAAVANSTVTDATDLATAIALVNDLKAKLNAKLTADRNSGQQA